MNVGGGRFLPSPYFLAFLKKRIMLVKPRTLRATYLVLLVFTSLLFSACAPSFPKDEEHAGKKPAECYECHLQLSDEHIPKDHFDDSDKLLEARTNCLKCHKSE